MKKCIVFFLKQCHWIVVLHIVNGSFATNNDSPAPMCCSKTVKSCFLRRINMAAKRSHSDRSLKLKYEVLWEPLIEEVRRAIELLEEFSLYSEFGKGIIKSVREVNHYVNREEQKTRRQSNITDFFKKTDW